MEIKRINDVELIVKEHQYQRVVTFKDIDAVHCRPEGTAKRNFYTNKKHFIEGEDFFVVSANEIRTNKIMAISDKVHQDIVLLSESGYLMLVKSFTDDLAWDVQRQLVKSYFRTSKRYVESPKLNRVAEIFDTIIMDFFRCMEKALQEKRYYLLPRTNGAEYCKPDPETLGLFDYQYYYIYNRRATSLFDEIHPEIPMRAVWNLLSLLGITENYSRKQVGSVITFMGRKAYAVRLIRSKCPIKLTTYGENRYLLVEKRYVEEDEYKALMLSSTDKNPEERS